MAEKYISQGTENADIPEVSESIIPKRERMVNALRRRHQKSIVPIEAVDGFIDATRRLGLEHVTIPRV